LRDILLSLSLVNTIEGGHIDGPENGPAPGPWDIPTQCEELFKDEKKNIEVPHTASVKVCTRV
jgi:hypothetical protein